MTIRIPTHEGQQPPGSSRRIVRAALIHKWPWLAPRAPDEVNEIVPVAHRRPSSEASAFLGVTGTSAPDEANERPCDDCGRPACRLCDADRDAGLCDDCYGRRKTWRAPDEVNEAET